MKALVVYAHARPQFLGQTLEGLKKNDLTGYDLHGYVDGPASIEQEPLVDATVQMLSDAGFTVVRRERNLGAGLHLIRAKAELFGRYQLVLQMEEDICPAPQAVPLLTALQDRVGPRSLTGLRMDCQLSLEDKKKALDQLVLDHGFHMCTITAEVWQTIAPVLLAYASRFLEDRPYSDLDHVGIRRFFRELLGKPVPVTFPTSQDACMRVACGVKNIRLVAPRVNYASHIGKDGTHCTPSIWEHSYMSKVVNHELPDAITAVLSGRIPAAWPYRFDAEHSDRVASLKRCVGHIFDRTGRLLYVGASEARMEFGADLHAAGHTIDVLEAWGPNCEFLRSLPWINNVIEADVRHAGQTLDGLYDYVFWWHGPEHLPICQLPSALAGLEEHAHFVVLGCPWGRYPQGAVGGNPYELHQAAIQPEELMALGYNVEVLPPEGIGGNITAWRDTYDMTTAFRD